MVEHFNTMTRHKIGGRAKAMVVTGSRLEAVRYKQSFDRYIKEKGYQIKSLVAFSGTVQDDKIVDLTYTEEGMNYGIREKELPEKFATQEYQVLLVAEKYQTGFDQTRLLAKAPAQTKKRGETPESAHPFERIQTLSTEARRFRS